MDGSPPRIRPPRITRLRVKNYRALKDVTLRDLTPLTAFVGPNGSGKSTVFDVFAFLSECFSEGLRRAWDRRGRFRELRSRGAQGPIEIEIKYKEPDKTPITYHLAIEEQSSGPSVQSEILQWTRGTVGKPFRFLEFHGGKGVAAPGEEPEKLEDREPSSLASGELLAVNTLGQFEKHPRVRALREFITGWHLSYLSAQDPRGTPEAGAQEHLSSTGDNLANVIQYLHEQHRPHLDRLLERLTQRVPRLERVDADILADGRLLLRIKDAPFREPILARYASDGTLKLLAYLVLIHDPRPPPLIGIEEPENFLFPRLLPELAEECNAATKQSQLLVTTHSPFFINRLGPEQVRVLYRDRDGYTKIQTAKDIPGVSDHVQEGASLGELWIEGHLSE